MSYEIYIQELAADEIEMLRPFDQRRVVNDIESQLSHQPTVATRRRKCLVGLTPSFEHVLPVWELRVGDVRVFYDVDEQARRVYVRAVRPKRASEQTKDIT